MMKIKKGDTVKVIAGKDKDKEGKVLAVKDGKVLVEGVNMVTYEPLRCKSAGRYRKQRGCHRCIQCYACCKRQSNPRWFQDGRRQEGSCCEGNRRSYRLIRREEVAQVEQQTERAVSERDRRSSDKEIRI